MKPAIEPVNRILASPRSRPRHPVRYIDGARDVGINHVADLRPVLLDETLPLAASGVGAEQVDRSAAEALQHALDLILRREVGPNPLHIDICNRSNSLRRTFDLGFVGYDDQIEVVLRTLLGKLQSEPLEAPVTKASFRSIFSGSFCKFERPPR